MILSEMNKVNNVIYKELCIKNDLLENKLIQLNNELEVNYNIEDMLRLIHNRNCRWRSSGDEQKFLVAAKI